jgi:hypothetical protein
VNCGDLATQDGVLVAKDQEFGVLGHTVARDGAQQTEKFARDPAGKDDQHPTMLSKLEEEKSQYVSIAQTRIAEPHRHPFFKDKHIDRSPLPSRRPDSWRRNRPANQSNDVSG